MRTPGVRESLERRFAEGTPLGTVTSLGYSFYTGLQFTCFDFPLRQGLLPRANAILVISDPDCRVVGIVDPFDRDMPNPKIPPVPRKPDEPFAVARPTTSEGAPFDRDALYPIEVRSRDFFERLQIGQASAKGTRCIYETGRNRVCIVYTENPLTPWAPDICDQWDDQVTYDEVTDDC